MGNRASESITERKTGCGSWRCSAPVNADERNVDYPQQGAQGNGLSEQDDIKQQIQPLDQEPVHHAEHRAGIKHTYKPYNESDGHYRVPSRKAPTYYYEPFPPKLEVSRILLINILPLTSNLKSHSRNAPSAQWRPEQSLQWATSFSPNNPFVESEEKATCPRSYPQIVKPPSSNRGSKARVRPRQVRPPRSVRRLAFHDQTSEPKLDVERRKLPRQENQGWQSSTNIERGGRRSGFQEDRQEERHRRNRKHSSRCFGKRKRRSRMRRIQNRHDS